MTFRGAIFDLDGTLLDTLADIGNAANAVLEHHGFPTHSLDEYRFFIGDGVRVLMERALPASAKDQHTLEACLETMRAEYKRHLNRTTMVYPGIPEMLEALRQRRLKLAVFSNKNDAFARGCVRDYFGSDAFDQVLGLRDGFPRKPDPAGALEIAEGWHLAPSEILYLGDTGTDMQTATSAGMFPIGVLWGFRERAELEQHGARWVLKHPSELIERLESTP